MERVIDTLWKRKSFLMYPFRSDDSKRCPVEFESTTKATNHTSTFLLHRDFKVRLINIQQNCQTFKRFEALLKGKPIGTYCPDRDVVLRKETVTYADHIAGYYRMAVEPWSFGVLEVPKSKDHTVQKLQRELRWLPVVVLPQYFPKSRTCLAMFGLHKDMYYSAMEGLREYLGRWAKTAVIHAYVPLPYAGESPAKIERFLDVVDSKRLSGDDFWYLWQNGTVEYFHMYIERMLGYKCDR